MNLYLVPIEEVLVGTMRARGPKYFRWRFDPDPENGLLLRYSGMDYGFFPSMLVYTPIITLEQHNWLVGQPGVFGWPDNLDTPVNKQAIQDFFEGINIPTDWITPSTSHRELLRQLAGIFQFNQRYSGIVALAGGGARSIFDNATLSTRLNQMTADEQEWFLQTVESFGYERSLVPLTATLRQLIKQAGDFWAGQSFKLGNFTF